MIENILAMLIGLLGGVFVGLMPSVTPTLGFLILLPLVSNDPVSLLIFAMTVCIGSQFFGSQAALYYRMSGETSSFPVLMEAKHFNTPQKIYKAVEITTHGSLFATALALALVMVLLPTGLFSYVVLPIYVRATIFALLLGLALFYPFKKIVWNLLGFAIIVFFANYSDIAANVKIGLTIFYFDPLYSLIVLFSSYFLINALSVKKVSTANVSRTKSLKLHKWYKKFIGHSILGMCLGLIPIIGATVASYASYGIEKLRGKMSLSRVAASETSNNSAVVSNWLPLLVFGMPITSIEIVFLQHFNQYGFAIQTLLELKNVLVAMLLCLLAAILYFLIALETNRTFYFALSRFITNPLFSAAVILLSLLTYASMNNFGLDMVLMHLLVFAPLGWLFHRLGTSLLVITVGLLLSNQIFFTFMQLYQIYF